MADRRSLKQPTPPVARRQKHVLEAHGCKRIDPYFWLSDRNSDQVARYLQAENAYTEAVMESTRPLQAKLVDEFKTHIKQTDTSVPYRLRGYLYYVRTEQHLEYPLYCRKREGEDAPEEIIADVNALAAEHPYYDLGALEVSPNNDVVAAAADTEGRRFFTITFRSLPGGTLVEDRIENVTDNLVWAEDGQTLLYTRQDPKTLRWHQVWRHRLGTPARQDQLVFEEPDETFSVEVSLSRSRRWLLIASEQTVTTEIRIVDARHPERPADCFLKRRRGHEYWIDHFQDCFYVLTNHRAINFRLLKTRSTTTPLADWDEVVPARDDVLLEDFELFQDRLVLEERARGLTRLRVTDLDGGDGHDIETEEEVGTVGLGHNPEADSSVVRYEYTSLVTPPSVFDYNPSTRSRTLLKQTQVGGHYEPRDYCSSRLWAQGLDQTSIPISLVWKKPLVRDGSRPLLLYSYGAYGTSLDPGFSGARISLLDRGWIVATAHVRGGEELGRAWYEAGRLSHKQNTFDDFAACGSHLVEQGYTAPERLFGWGGSAGGLLIGAVANQAPELFAGLVAEVPFVDVVTTMLDPSVPLTTGEFDEWGDPREKAAFDWMLAYSPYDNVRARQYPALLVTAGLHDSQVQYWEPAKWVAKLRATKTDNNILLLKTTMEAGHSGATSRSQRYSETALIYAFLIELAEGGPRNL